HGYLAPQPRTDAQRAARRAEGYGLDLRVAQCGRVRRLSAAAVRGHVSRPAAGTLLDPRARSGGRAARALAALRACHAFAAQLSQGRRGSAGGPRKHATQRLEIDPARRSPRASAADAVGSRESRAQRLKLWTNTLQLEPADFTGLFGGNSNGHQGKAGVF